MWPTPHNPWLKWPQARVAHVATLVLLAMMAPLPKLSSMYHVA